MTRAAKRDIDRGALDRSWKRRAKTLANESGIGSETLQRYLPRHDGIAQGRGTAEGLRKLRAANAKTVLVVDEKQLGAVEAGKPFAQMKAAGMQTAVMDDILRQRDAELKAAVRPASPAT